MVDIDTFLTFLYVMVDDFCKQCLAPETPQPGPAASLTRSEVVTLALFSQWQPFGSERGFYRYAQRHLRGTFPTLPDRGQFNRLLRQHEDAVVACLSRTWRSVWRPSTVPMRRWMPPPPPPAMPSAGGWAGCLAWPISAAANRLSWYEGFHVLLSVNPVGAITGFGFGAASAKDQSLAETFFALRHTPDPALASVGAPAAGVYVTDKGFEGQERRRSWQDAYGAVVLCAPKRNSRHPWPRAWRRWLAGLRQIVETVNGSLLHVFRLDRERPHTLKGFQVRLAAKMALHNFCIWLNQQLGRPLLAFADLVAW
jgi:DDE family transposase